MTSPTDPAREWSSGFGKDYTDRNPRSFEEVDDLYRRQFGVTRSQLNREFLGSLDPAFRVLEVGTNIGNQLRGLRAMGFQNLFGIEIQDYALRQARRLSPELAFVRGGASALPFPDASFDLVFTSGVLIHVPPDARRRVLDEIHRAARTWIWGYEYYSSECREVPYRGRQGLLWKDDFARIYLGRFSDLELVRERRFRYAGSDLEDTMFLLRKRRAGSAGS